MLDGVRNGVILEDQTSPLTFFWLLLVQCYCPKLQVLRLGWCKAITDDGLEALAQASPKQLFELDLSLTRISNHGLSALQRIIYISPVRSLDLSASDVQADALLASLMALKSTVILTDLKLDFLSDLSLRQMSTFFESDASRRLVQFQINHCTASTTETTPRAVNRVIQTALARNQRDIERSASSS